MIRTFDEKNLGKRPPPFSYTPSKNLERRVCVDRAENTHFETAFAFLFGGQSAGLQGGVQKSLFGCKENTDRPGGARLVFVVCDFL
jgi:hypothetical protein